MAIRTLFRRKGFSIQIRKNNSSDILSLNLFGFEISCNHQKYNPMYFCNECSRKIKSPGYCGLCAHQLEIPDQFECNTCGEMYQKKECGYAYLHDSFYECVSCHIEFIEQERRAKHEPYEEFIVEDDLPF